MNGTCIAWRTCEGSREPDVQAEPLEAQIPIELCSRGVECRIMASDMAVAMLEHARLNVEIAGYIEQIQLAQLDADVEEQ